MFLADRFPVVPPVGPHRLADCRFHVAPHPLTQLGTGDAKLARCHGESADAGRLFGHSLPPDNFSLARFTGGKVQFWSMVRETVSVQDELRKWLPMLRATCGISQNGFAVRAGIDPSILSRWLNGKITSSVAERKTRETLGRMLAASIVEGLLVDRTAQDARHALGRLRQHREQQHMRNRIRAS